LAGLLFAIRKFLSKWLKFLQEDKIAGGEAIKQGAYKKASQVLDSARKESLDIVTEASSKAKEVLSSVGELSTQSKESFNEVLTDLENKQAAVLEKTASELQTFYEKTIKDQEAKSLHVLEEVTEDVEEEMLHEVEEFKDILHKETVGSQQVIEQELKKEYDKVASEIEVYREKQLKKIDETIFTILHDVSASVLGEALDVSEHEKLVLDALEDAKSANIFPK